MELTYDQATYTRDAEAETSETLRIPLADVVTASLLSLALWVAIGWTLWAMVG